MLALTQKEACTLICQIHRAMHYWSEWMLDKELSRTPETLLLIHWVAGSNRSSSQEQTDYPWFPSKKKDQLCCNTFWSQNTQVWMLCHLLRTLFIVLCWFQTAMFNRDKNKYSSHFYTSFPQMVNTIMKHVKLRKKSIFFQKDAVISHSAICHRIKVKTVM